MAHLGKRRSSLLRTASLLRVRHLPSFAFNGPSDYVAHGCMTPCVCVCVAEAEELLKTWGRNELEEKSVPSWLIFLQQLYAPMPIMIWVAIIIEAAILNFIDMGRYSRCTGQPPATLFTRPTVLQVSCWASSS